jgi:hypothetical protein
VLPGLGTAAPQGTTGPAGAADPCDRTAQNNSVLLPKPVHMDIKQ